MAPLSAPILVASVGGFFVACTLFGVAAGLALERLSPRRIWALPVPAGQRRHELWGNLVFLCIVTAACSLLWASGRVRAAPGLGRDAATFAALYLSFQAYFYGLHRLLHTRALVRFHRWHHESRVTTPLSGQSVGLLEAIGWALGYAGLPLLLSLAAPIGPGGLVAYLAFNVIGNIVGHANVELVPPSRTLWWRSTLSAVFTFHALHHARWTGNYGFASTWADRLLGTEWPDWPALHRRVWEGAPLTSFRDRG